MKWLPAALVAGYVTEELLFRGYAVERLEEWTDSRGVAAGVSTFVFVVLHRSERWSWQSVLRIAQPAAVQPRCTCGSVTCSP
jgi:membrane protease YdiL (CAAX protease family)